MFTVKSKPAQLGFILSICSMFFACNEETTDPINGVDGINGFNALVEVQNEPVGDNCSSGGTRISIGQDSNENELLDDSEIVSTSYVCNGSPGSAGTALVVRTSAENPGENCESGGTLLEIGADLNSNTTLDDDEVQTAFFICNGQDNGNGGSDGLNSLIRATPLEDCGGNGVSGLRIEIGLDANGNGQLDTDPNEVQSTYELCNGTNGVNAILSCVNEDAGDNCANGGISIEIGLDSNANGMLDEDEKIGEPKFVCNGADGVDGKSPIVTSTTDVSCSNGGIELTFGYDNDGNGSIDEILETITICNGGNGADGSNGFNSIIRTSVSTSCDNGGTFVEVGIDTNENGMLDPDEVDSAFDICNGADGSNGLNSVIDVETFTGNAGTCNTNDGGIIIRVGIDDNENGSLDIPEEVDQTQYICNGNDGTNGNSDNIYEFYIANGFDGYEQAIDVSINDDSDGSASNEYGETLSVDLADGNSSNSVLYFPRLEELVKNGVNDASFEVVEAILYLKTFVPDERTAPTFENWIGVKTMTSEAPLVVDRAATWYAADGSDAIWKSPGASITEAGGANGFSDQFRLPNGFFFDGYVPLLLNRTEITSWISDESLNKGMILTMAQTNTYGIDFYSSEYSLDVYFRPTLYIKVKTDTKRVREGTVLEKEYKQVWQSMTYEEKLAPLSRRLND
ncbi:MAG: hypothetical protein ABJG47_13620 [Ekhidna sp.]